jgi:hypothetical protein
MRCGKANPLPCRVAGVKGIVVARRHMVLLTG